ncbi:MAG TPA: rod shape-determining protein MreC [Allosphingosinicella sp.]|nr:rod shape-determining protein MreC [Allosphingosinicella sp.]
MAPPSSRRPGFSRRAQYGLFLGYVTAVAGVLFAILLLVVAVVDPRGFNALRGAALDLTTPISSAGRGVVRFFTGSAEDVANYFKAGKQNSELKRELEQAHHRLIEARAIEFENERLKRLLKLAGEVTDQIAIARIVSSTFDSSRRLATLDAGSAAGIRIGQPVRSPEGLLGRIVETGRHASRVLLITDGANNVPVRLVRDGTPAMATGRGDGTIDLKPLEIGQNPFRRGDIFITSGVGGIYSPGVPVAMVVRATRDETVARPLADPSRVDFAIVQSLYMPAADQPLDTASPASPAPAAAARR